MSAAFQLDLTPEENNERLAAAVTSYGVGTRSYNHSTEKIEVDRQRAAATEHYQNSPRAEVLAPISCACDQRPYPHDLKAHSKMFEAPGGYWIWQGGADDVYVRFSEDERMRWPWSLRLRGDMPETVGEFA
jgi:hypothetical protein